MFYMLVSNEAKIANEWKKYEWYTVRPLLSTTAYYQSLIQSYTSDTKFLIYGGTPEIRSLFQKLNFKVTIIDQSKETVRALGLLTSSKRPLAKNEKYFQMNWLVNKHADDCYDFIIGDDAINMVEWPQFDTFLANTHRMLKQDGIFVCHLLVKPDDEWLDKSFADIISECKQGKIKSNYDLASRLNFICFDKKTYAMGWQRTIKMLGVDQLNSFKPNFDFIKIFGLCNSQFYCPPQAEFEKKLSVYFDIQEIFYPHEHEYCLFEPVYLLKKNKDMRNERIINSIY